MNEYFMLFTTQINDIVLSMSDDLKGAIITAIVTSIISIIGFFLTNYSMKKTFKNELLREKTVVHIEKMSEVPFRILNMMEEMVKDPNSKHVLDEFIEVLNTTCAYGSTQAIRIAANMQSENYLYARTKQFNLYRAMAHYALLVTQIKYDVTGIINSPDMWFKMKLKDYPSSRSAYAIANNQLVDELDLNKDFII